MTSWVNAINKPGGLPSIKTAWRNIQENECKSLFKQIKTNIKSEADSKLSDILPIDENQLNAILKEILDNYVNTISNNEILRDNNTLKEKILKELKSNWMIVYND